MCAADGRRKQEVSRADAVERIWDAFLSENDRRMLDRRPVRERVGLGRRPALLVIDMQDAVLGEHRPYADQADRHPGACGAPAWTVLRSMPAFIASARARDVPIVYTRHIFHPGSGHPRSISADPLSSLNDSAQICAPIRPDPTDIVIDKTQPSAFNQTGLILCLQRMGVDSVVLIGNSTSGCVRATAIDALGFSFGVTVVEDLVFDRVEASHAISLFDLSFKYCDVVASELVFENPAQPTVK